MANIKEANDNPTTKEVVAKMKQRDAKRIKAEEDFNAETAVVCDLVNKAKKQNANPINYDEAAMVELVARVPIPVVQKYVEHQDTRHFHDEFPCLTNFILGLATGIFLTAVACFVGVLI